MTIVIVLLIVLAVIYLYCASLIRKKTRALEALSGIDVQLELRADTVPNVLKIARRFMEHESELLREITALRSRATQTYDHADAQQVQEHLAAASTLGNRMSQLVVSLEDYPELKSDATMTQAQQTLSEVEVNIAAARRFYNSAVGELNTAVQIFPGNVLAGLVGVGSMPFFKASAAAAEPVDADAYLR
jgi:LemA protein